MKIIFSRKGFDSSFGGAPSPILPDGSLLSLPIPGGSSPLRYGHIQAPLKLDAGRIAETLTKGKIRARHPAHLDPDLDERSLPRIDGWRPSLGQTGAAQAHLAAQGVGPGDLFLFFGWFRKTVFLPDGSLAYDSSSPAIHTLFGHLQIESSLPLGPRPDAKAWLRRHPWLLNHPHLSGTREANNTLHLASPDLLLPGLKQKLPGAGAFLAFSEPLRLSAPDSPKSL